MRSWFSEEEATEMIVMGFIEPFTKRTSNGIRGRNEPFNQVRNGR